MSMQEQCEESTVTYMERQEASETFMWMQETSETFVETQETSETFMEMQETSETFMETQEMSGDGERNPATQEIPPQTVPEPEEEESVFQDNVNVSKDIQEGRPRAWRSAPPSPISERRGISSSLLSLQTEEFLELLSTVQTRRLEEQRAELPLARPRQARHFSVPSYRQLSLPVDDRGLLAEFQRRRGGSWAGRSQKKKPPTIKIPAQEELYNTILGHQAERMEEQRCSPPLPSSAADLFEILFRVQGNRMDEQRVELPSPLENACS